MEFYLKKFRVWFALTTSGIHFVPRQLTMAKIFACFTISAAFPTLLNSFSVAVMILSHASSYRVVGLPLAAVPCLTCWRRSFRALVTAVAASPRSRRRFSSSVASWRNNRWLLTVRFGRKLVTFRLMYVFQTWHALSYSFSLLCHLPIP